MKENYDYIVYVNGNKYKEVHSHQELIELIEEIRVDRGQGAKYEINLVKL